METFAFLAIERSNAERRRAQKIISNAVFSEKLCGSAGLNDVTSARPARFIKKSACLDEPAALWY
jgi:hypothetical protein